jgi:hypothetical protein
MKSQSIDFQQYATHTFLNLASHLSYIQRAMMKHCCKKAVPRQWLGIARVIDD